MRGIVMIDDFAQVHVVPRAEVRHVEVVSTGGDDWALKYQLAGTVVVRSIAWRGDCRPASLKEKIGSGEYNQMIASALMATITRGQRDVHIERRGVDGVLLFRSGVLEDDARVVLCRKFITDHALLARQTALGPLDDTRIHLLGEICAAARDLILPDWFPLKEDAS